MGHYQIHSGYNFNKNTFAEQLSVTARLLSRKLDWDVTVGANALVFVGQIRLWHQPRSIFCLLTSYLEFRFETMALAVSNLKWQDFE